MPSSLLSPRLRADLASSQWGERPHAFVVLKPGSKWHGKHAEFETELKTFGRKKLSAFAVPEWIEVVAPEELPKTSTGKSESPLSVPQE